MKTELAIGIICILGMIITGCSNNVAKENWTVTRTAVDGSSVSMTYRGEVGQQLLAYFTTTKQIEGVTPLSSIVVGEIMSEPDPNSISASGGLAGELIKAIIR